MSDDAFTHDASTFDPGEQLADLVDDVEARYADLVAEVIWDGIITPTKRSRLTTAAKTFGLSAERAEQIESALALAHERMHEQAIYEERTDDGEDAARDSISPFAAPEDPRLQMLQGRINTLEERNRELRDKLSELLAHKGELEALVEQLQAALGSTLDDLDAAHSDPPAALEAATDAGDDGPTSSFRPVSERPAADADEGPPLIPSAVDTLVPSAKRPRSRRPIGPPPVSMRQVASSRRVLPSRGDPAEIHRIVRMQPRDPELLRALYGALARADDVDRRWCIAHTLVHLGAANDEERELHDKHATDALVRPSRAVNEDEWRELLFHPGEDSLTGEILAEIAPAVLLGQLTALRRDSVAVHVDPGLQIDPRQSTLQAARCFGWAAAFLGMSVPPLYATPDDPGIATSFLNPGPSIRLGKEALVGRSGKELAFIAGRQLTWHRNEHLLIKPARSMRLLEDVFLAALMLGNPGLPMTPDIKRRVEPLASTIRPLLQPAALERLQQCFGRFVQQGGRTNLLSWVQGVDRTAACTGLLLCNDLRVAEHMLGLESPQKVTERMDELIVFFTAGRCSLLRKRVGIALLS